MRRGVAAFRGRASLARRILLVNTVALLISGISIFYLDGFRARLIAERRAQAEYNLRIVGAVIARTPAAGRPRMIDAAGRASLDRLRLYDEHGNMLVDSWQVGPRSFWFADPDKQTTSERVGRWLDAALDRVVRARIPPPFVDYGRAPAGRWSELNCVMVAEPGTTCSSQRLAPDRTPVLTAAFALQSRPQAYLLSVRDARDVSLLVRAERLRLFMIVLSALALSIALSVFLARTIVRPLRDLTRAAMRVRAGRDRDVVVPRLPERHDEIGVLARAVSDMAGALRTRIDATEGFAADVSHELKNPLASVASAVESLERVDDPTTRKQLTDIIAKDVHRMRRLISDISALSRLDSQLTRSEFAPVDVGELVDNLIATRFHAHQQNGVRLNYVAPMRGRCVVMGEPERLGRAIDNVIDNALSFSPPGGIVAIAVTADRDHVSIIVDDDGPGVPEAARAAIFERFHGDRPDDDGFGNHSGLGLAIARTIVVGHSGTISVTDRPDGKTGARFVISLPAMERD